MSDQSDFVKRFASDIQEILDDYLKENLKIRVKVCDSSSYGSDVALQVGVEVLLGDKVVAEDSDTLWSLASSSHTHSPDEIY